MTFEIKEKGNNIVRFKLKLLLFAFFIWIDLHGTLCLTFSPFFVLIFFSSISHSLFFSFSVFLIIFSLSDSLFNFIYITYIPTSFSLSLFSCSVFYRYFLYTCTFCKNTHSHTTNTHTHSLTDTQKILSRFSKSFMVS